MATSQPSSVQTASAPVVDANIIIAIYIALAEDLAASRPTTLLTFDENMGKHAAREVPSVTVHLIAV